MSDDTKSEVNGMQAWLRMTSLRQCVLTLLLLASFLRAAGAAYSVPPVEVQLVAPWQTPPLLIEILETAERERRGSLFTLIDSFLTTISAKDASDEKILSQALRAFDEQAILSKPGQRATFLSSLALHAETPRIVAAWQLYNTSGLQERVKPHTLNSSVACDSWVDYGDQVLCSVTELKSALSRNGRLASSESATFLPGDHTLHSYDPQKTTAILYADLKSDNFLKLHAVLSEHADAINYILRWKPVKGDSVALLSGFGAYLDLKKVDYLVIDDRKLGNMSPPANSATINEQTEPESQDVRDRKWLASMLRTSEESKEASLSSLNDEEIRPLGMRAAQVIMESKEPIRAMKELAQNFPSHAVSLARDASPPPSSLRAEVEQMQATMIEAGGEDIWLNGKSVNAKDFQPLGLLSIMRDERTLIDSLTTRGMSNREIRTMLMSPNISKAFTATPENAQAPTFDASDRIERASILGKRAVEEGEPGAITYWNDLEAKDDVRYANWPSDLRSLLRPLYPGSFPIIRRNIFNVIVAMDPANLETIQLLSDNVQMAANKVGLRWGFVPLLSESSDETSTRMAHLIWLAVRQLDTTVTSKWLRRVAMLLKEHEKVDIDVAGRELDKFLYTTAAERAGMLQELDVTDRIAMSMAWARRLRPNEGGSGGVFLNGQYMPYHAQIFQSLHQLIAMQLQTLAPLIYYGHLDETKTQMSTYFYDLPETYTARSELLFPPEGGRLRTKAINLANLNAAALTSLVGDDNRGAIAVWAVGDRDSAKVHRLQSDLATITQEQSIPYRTLHASDIGIDIPEDDVGFLVNGKLIYGFDPHNIALAEYQAVIEQERRKAELVQSFIKSARTIDVVIASSIVNAAFFVDSSKEGFFTSTSTARSALVDTFSLPHMSFTIGDVKTAALHFSLLLNPVGDNVQKWSGVLNMLEKQPDVVLRVILNPNTNLTELPLRRFYRSTDATRLQFDGNGRIAEQSLVFHDMPKEAVLTMGLDAPPAWLTMPIEAIYDLDNIRLRDAMTPTVRAVYELRNILIEGHVRDTISRATPRGLELVLESNDGKEKLDTIVMANLAYFQFRAKPGYYRLRIREGRSANLFETVSVGNAGWDSPPVELTGDVIVLNTFHGSTLYPRVAKRKGMEKQMLVVDEEADRSSRLITDEEHPISSAGGPVGSVWKKVRARLSSVLPPMREEDWERKGVQNEHAEINVFTVASGHLYERMTYIMILSTLKHTTRSVKFWFIENFLSPSFKSFIPHLAKEYGFKYEMVTYAWPHWLRPQTEKQRSIWGMKVLFLDVLFPLSLSNVIFVDADQIVRADLMELVQTDLQGAPYGFAPMGNDSYDMDNFRFWETGYWKQFLRGKPYPISALYVVDLNRFRLLAAGDKLRGHYQALSADPNSLSNLDQDLVASMIHNVPIFSLPREWLWCETWCSTDWYDEAKSIDLCSNPKTHEPKLDRARRQIPEWTPLDEEVGRLARRLEEEGTLQANVVASSGSTGNVKIERTDDRSHDEL